MKHYDSIIIGAGHNGLVCAAYLAKQGQSILILESSGTPGGLAASREFHPGFRLPVAHCVAHFSTKIVHELALRSHGFKRTAATLPTIGLNPDGEHVIVQQGEVSGVTADDAAAYQKYSQQMQRFAKMLAPFWLRTMPGIGTRSLAELMTFAAIGLKMRLLGKHDMHEFLRVVALPTRDLMDEYFDSPLLKAVLSWDGLIGSKQAPRSPNHSILTMLYRMSDRPQFGVASLIGALQSAASGFGAEIRTRSSVERILIQANKAGLAACGVQLSNGEKIEAGRVISALDPQTTFLTLVGIENLEIEFTNRIRRLRCEGYVAKLHLALSGLPDFTGLQEPVGRLIIAPDMDVIEFAFDDAKYAQWSQHPVMEITLPSLHDDALSPDGCHVLSAHVMYVPYRINGGWNASARASLCERVIDTLARYAPNIRELILHQELLTPQDLERNYGVTGGHWHHTELALDQALMMRPTYEAAQYRTPIPGLYLCGAGSHPGGDLTGGPGHNAAREILR